MWSPIATALPSTLEPSSVLNASAATPRPAVQAELKRNAIDLLRANASQVAGNVFDIDKDGTLTTNFPAAAAYGALVRFFENSFEWNNMTYLFYPYIWARSSKWSTLQDQSDTDR